MSVSIRLSNVGRKREHKFRIVASTTKSKLKGKVLEVIGFWDKTSNNLNLNKERLNYWQSRGAKLTSAVEKLSHEKV